VTHCPKLHAAYAAMLVELLGRGAVPIVFCTERAREFGISERTLFKAKLPIKVVHVPCTGGRAYWELANGYHGKRFTCETGAPSWRPPRPARPCADCGEPMHGAHSHARRCTGCQATRRAREARRRYRKLKSRKFLIASQAQERVMGDELVRP
jgi:hypothetical protein